jgi:hypothetical protein
MKSPAIGSITASWAIHPEIHVEHDGVFNGIFAVMAFGV